MYLCVRDAVENENNYLLLKCFLLDIFRPGAEFTEELKFEIMSRFDYLIFRMDEENRKFQGLVVRELNLVILELEKLNFEEIVNSLKGLLVFFRNRSLGLPDLELE